MGDLSRNFSRKEFACKCGCGFDTVDAELVSVLQESVRNRFGRVIISSGCRCKKRNAEEGGAPKSQHLNGKACDFIAPNDDMDYIYTCLNNKFQNKYGIGKYLDEKGKVIRIHFDVRPEKARWIK